MEDPLGYSERCATVAVPPRSAAKICFQLPLQGRLGVRDACDGPAC